jgi:hypothetical protein
MPSTPLATLTTSLDASESIKKVQALLDSINSEFTDSSMPAIDISRIRGLIEELRTVGLPEQVFAAMNVTAMELIVALTMTTQWPELLEKLADCSARLAIALDEISPLKEQLGKGSEMQEVNGEIVAWMHTYNGRVRHAVRLAGSGAVAVQSVTLCSKYDWFHPKGRHMRKCLRCVELAA